MAKMRLAESARIHAKNGDRKGSRVEFNPTTLVRPICGCCGKPMWLGSSGDYASFTCLNGREGKHDCTYRGYKTVKIMENAILNHVLNDILTEERFGDLVTNANGYLAEEAAKPTFDTSAWKTEIKQTTVKRNRLAEILDGEGTEDLGVVVAKLRKHENRIKELKGLVRDAESTSVACRPIERADALDLLGQIRRLLNEEVSQAAPLLREITGPVVVHLTREPGRSRPVWTAEFTVNLVPVVAKLAAVGNLPSTGTWEYLNTRTWSSPLNVEVSLEKTPRHERLGPEFKKLHEQGATVSDLVAAHGITWVAAKEILNYGLTGEPPKWKAGKRTGKGSREIYKKISPDVVRLRDEEKMSIPRIQEWLLENKDIRVGRATVQRAYDHAHRENICRMWSKARNVAERPIHAFPRPGSEEFATCSWRARK